MNFPECSGSLPDTAGSLRGTGLQLDIRLKKKQVQGTLQLL
jgi:hypothetical protein